MKLNSLHIDNYKLLNDFSIHFKNDVCILIGINGSGKSSVLETIAQIFSDAALNQRSKFAFSIEYELRLENIIEQTATSSEFKTDYIRVQIYSPKSDDELFFKVYVGDQLLEDKFEIEKRFNSLHKILPSNVVIYYSGLSNVMRNICEPHNLILSRLFREGNSFEYVPFFYFEPELFDIILISMLSYEFGNVPLFLREKAKIRGIENIRIRLKKPGWAKQKIDKWWGARGEIKTFLDFLSSKTDTIEIKEPLNTNDHSRNGNIIMEVINDDFIIITILGQNKLFEIREYLIEEKALFTILNTLYIDGFWFDASFSFIKEEDGIISSFSILSEGEEQAITIKGLVELTTSENTLFLFDEPDTFLHPSWQRNFIESITNYVAHESSSLCQFLITTHSPQLLSNANPEKAEVQIMEDGEIIKVTPKYYGRDISTILYEMMGVERRNKKVTKLLSNLFNLIEDGKLDKGKIEYIELKNLLGEDDPAIIRAKTQLDYLEESDNEANSKITPS
jgi:predicted ATPase